MITTKLDNGRVFLHNGDFSGNLLINVAPGEVDYTETVPGEPTTWRVALPFEDVKAIVAEYVRRERTTALETASDDDILFRT